MKQGIPFGPGNGFVPAGMLAFGLVNSSQTLTVNRIPTTTAPRLAIVMIEVFEFWFEILGFEIRRRRKMVAFKRNCLLLSYLY